MTTPKYNERLAIILGILFIILLLCMANNFSDNPDENTNVSKEAKTTHP